MWMILPVIGWFSATLWNGGDASGNLTSAEIRQTRPRVKRAQPSLEDLAANRLRSGNLLTLAACLKEWHANDPRAMETWIHQIVVSSRGDSEPLLVSLVHAGLPELALRESVFLMDAQRQQAVGSVFSTLVRSDTARAWELSAAVQSDELRDQARDIILTQSPDTGLGGLASLALGRGRSAGHDAVLGNVLSRWLRQDPAEATSWLVGNPVPQEIRDQVSLQLVVQCDALDRPAATAMAWAENISASDQRYQAFGRAARELAADDPAAAAEAIRQTDVLTPDEKQSLLAGLSLPAREHDFPPPD